MANSVAVRDENVVMTAEELAVARDMGMVPADEIREVQDLPENQDNLANLHGPVVHFPAPPAPKPQAPKVRRLLVCGSRSHWEFDLISGFVMEALRKFPDAEWFISGGAKGADAISAFILEKKLGKKVVRMEAQWDDLGGAAGFARNWQMIMRCDAVAALWDGASKGTKQTIDAAKRMNKPVFEWTIPAIPEPGK